LSEVISEQRCDEWARRI